MIVTLPPETEKKIIALAAQKSVDPASLIALLVEKELGEQETLTPANGVGHTPEQKKAAQERAIREFTSGIELPPGVSAQEVMDALRGDGTDDDDPDALKKATEKNTKRTPEEREAIRQELLKAIPSPLPIPQGKTVFDMFFRVRGDETEEQVYEALQRLS